MPSYAQWMVGLIIAAAFVIPFYYPRHVERSSKPWITISQTGNPGVGDVLGATLPLLLVVFGLYASFVLKAPGRVLLAALSPLSIFICLFVLLPVHAIKRFLFPLLRVYLACLGVLIAISNTHGLITAYRLGEIRFVPTSIGSLDPVTASFAQEPLTFWLVVIGVAVTLAAVLSFFRLAIVNLWRRLARPAENQAE